MNTITETTGDYEPAIVKPDEQPTFKCEKANRILSGEETYSPKQWREDLRLAMQCDDSEDEATKKRHYEFHKFIIYLGAVQDDFSTIKAAVFEAYPGLAKDKKNKKVVVDLIKGIRKDCSDLEEMLIAMLVRKCLDFEAKGLTEQKAWDLAGNWLVEEIL
jgi:hypothetical protein